MKMSPKLVSILGISSLALLVSCGSNDKFTKVAKTTNSPEKAETQSVVAPEASVAEIAQVVPSKKSLAEFVIAGATATSPVSSLVAHGTLSAASTAHDLVVSNTAAFADSVANPVAKYVVPSAVAAASTGTQIAEAAISAANPVSVATIMYESGADINDYVKTSAGYAYVGAAAATAEAATKNVAADYWVSFLNYVSQ